MDATPRTALAALGPAGPYVSRRTQPVTDPGGTAVAELSQVPPAAVTDWLRQSVRLPDLPRPQILARMSRAAGIFAGSVGGVSYDEHLERVSRVTGLPLPLVRRVSASIIDALAHGGHHSLAGMPRGCVPADEQPASGAGAHWVRRGRTLGVIAAGNSPGIPAMWLDALALGYRVAVRPSHREPDTVARVALALREAGLPAHYVMVIPTAHAGVDTLVERADLAMVYGGQDVVTRYQGRADVLVQGPGRSKVVVPAGADRQDSLLLAEDSMLYHSGTACTSASAVLVDGDARGFAADLVSRLQEAGSWAGRLCRVPEPTAEALVRAVHERLSGAEILLEPRILEAEEGGRLITPVVVLAGGADHPLVRTELALPMLTVAPVTDEDTLTSSLAGSLVVSLTAPDARLREAAGRAPGVRSLYVGLPTGWTDPAVPHDGFLGEFLMCSRGVACRTVPRRQPDLAPHSTERD